MSQAIENDVNTTRYTPGQTAGHYESFFLRANHPTEPRAFWIRYTIFSPLAHPENAVGELWAIYFDGITGNHVAVRQEFPFADCAFDRAQLGVRIADSRLEPGQLSGSSAFSTHAISWNLAYDGASEPLFLLPLRLYQTKFPQAKSLVPLPLATFNGALVVDGERLEIVDWVGSQNHNWGSKHTDFYAWGQVAGFDGHPDSFLEVATARLKLGAFWTPFLTFFVLRYHGAEIKLNRMLQAVRAHASIESLRWTFRTENADFRVEGVISAPREAFVGLLYANPPGGSKLCLNSKIAVCELTVTRKRTGQTERLVSQRAAFELLTDDNPLGMTIHIDPKNP